MNPPTCRTCGKAEWRHICGGTSKRDKAFALQRAREAEKAVQKKPTKKAKKRANAKGR